MANYPPGGRVASVVARIAILPHDASMSRPTERRRAYLVQRNGRSPRMPTTVLIARIYLPPSTSAHSHPIASATFKQIPWLADMQPRKLHVILVVQIATASQNLAPPGPSITHVFLFRAGVSCILLDQIRTTSPSSTRETRLGDLTSTNVNVELALILLAEVTRELLGTAIWRNIWTLEFQLSLYDVIDAKPIRDGAEGVREGEDRRR